MDDRIEMLLQVDALAQTISCHKYSPRCLPQGLNAVLAFSSWQAPGDCLDGDGFWKCRSKALREVVRCVDESTEDDRIESFIKKVPHDGDTPSQLSVGGAIQTLCLFC